MNLILAKKYLHENKKNIFEITLISITLYLIGSWFPINYIFLFVLIKLNCLNNNIVKTFCNVCQKYFSKTLNFCYKFLKKDVYKPSLSNKLESNNKKDDTYLANKLESNNKEDDTYLANKSNNNRSIIDSEDNSVNDNKKNDDNTNLAYKSNNNRSIINSEDDVVNDNKNEYDSNTDYFLKKKINYDSDTDYSFKNIRKKIDNYMNNKIIKND